MKMNQQLKKVVIMKMKMRMILERRSKITKGKRKRFKKMPSMKKPMIKSEKKLLESQKLFFFVNVSCFFDFLFVFFSFQAFEFFFLSPLWNWAN